MTSPISPVVYVLTAIGITTAQEFLFILIFTGVMWFTFWIVWLVLKPIAKIINYPNMYH